MIKFLKKFYYAKLNRELGESETILDVGCDNSSIVERLSGNFRSTGLDAYKPYIEESRQKNIHDDYIIGDLLTVQIPEKSFDAVIAFDVVEHFDRAEGGRFLSNLERWARKKIIVATPNGFAETLECHRRVDAELDHLQMHKSGWSVDDFRARGYQIRGLEGFKSTRNKEGLGWRLLHKATYPLSYVFPRSAFRLLTIKNL